MLTRLAKAAPDYQADALENTRKALQERHEELEKTKRILEEEVRQQLENRSIK
jgi:hypothetical protein